MQAFIGPEFEFDLSRNVFNPMVWRGREGWAQWMQEAGEVWLPPKITVVRLEEVDEARVFSAIVVENVGRESGVSTTMPFWQVWTFADGLVTRVVNFNDEASGLVAAGLDA